MTLALPGPPARAEIMVGDADVVVRCRTGLPAVHAQHPGRPDGIRAAPTHGVLEPHAPKAESAKPRKVEIKTA